MNKRCAKQQGQSMVEYTVILMALTVALLGIGYSDSTGNIGLNKDEEGSLLNAVHNRYTEQAYALSITELPEHPDYGDLVQYYASHNKYPSLQPWLNDADSALNQFESNVLGIENKVNTLSELSPESLVKLGKQELENAKDDAIDQIKDSVNILP